MQRKKISAQIERRITTAAIISDVFLRQYAQMHDPEIIQTEFVRVVLDWCLSYFKQYQKAPGEHIQDVFEDHEDKLDPDEADLIADFLESISDEYERAETINAQYLYDQAQDYVRTRKLQNIRQDIQVHLQNGDTTAAETCLNSYTRPEVSQVQGVDPFDDKEAIEEAFNSRLEPLLELPGALSLFDTQMTRDALVGIQAPEKRGKCIAANSLIALADGSVATIADVVKRKIKNIIAFDEAKQRFVESVVTDHYDNGEKECVETITRTGRKVQTTLNHPFLTPSGWKNIEELQAGDRIAVPKHLPFFGTVRSKNTLLKMLAYMIAEGGMTSKNSPTFTSTYMDIQIDFEQCVESLGSSTTWAKDLKTVYIVNNKENKRKHGGNPVMELLKDFGLMEVHSRDKKIPDIIFKQTEKGLSRFLRTLYTCDGSIYAGNIEYSSASQNMIMQLQALLTRFGIVSGVKYKKVKCNDKEFDHWYLLIRDQENIKLFLEKIGFDFHKKERAISILRGLKGKKERSFLDTTPPEITKNIQSILKEQAQKMGIGVYSRIGKGLHEALRNSIANNKPIMRSTIKSIQEKTDIPAIQTIIDSDILWDAIESITPVGKTHTYDLTVAKHHNFVADNCLVHNTWTLMFFANLGHAQRLNVAFFSVGDMSQPQFIRRQHISLARKSDDPRYCGELLVPVLDCERNQMGACNTNHGPDQLGVYQGGVRVDFDAAEDYEVCTNCRRHDPKNFRGAHWYEKRGEVTPLTSHEAYKNGVRHKKRTKAKRFRLSTHPSNSLSATGIDNILQRWEDEDGWVADLIAIDYADIMDQEEGIKEFRHQENAKWKKLRHISQKRHALVIVATQADVKAHEQARQKVGNFSEDKRKMAHVTAMFALNQTPEEKRDKIMRFQALLLREDENDSEQDIVMLQCLQQGRPHIASYVQQRPLNMEEQEDD